MNRRYLGGPPKVKPDNLESRRQAGIRLESLAGVILEETKQLAKQAPGPETDWIELQGVMMSNAMRMVARRLKGVDR